jgi:hypothetical protein
VLLLFLCGIIAAGLRDTYRNPCGEPFVLTGGISIWPSELLRWLVLTLSVFFMGKALGAVQSGVLAIAREYRLPLNQREDTCQLRWTLASIPVPQAGVEAENVWILYQQLGNVWQRVCRTVFPCFLYFLFALGIFLLDRMPYVPARGQLASTVDKVSLMLSIVAFLLLTFWIMEAVRLCRWVIEQLSEAHTRYPQACLDHFAERRNVPPDLLNEWLDLQLIADLTNHVGRLIFYPFIVFFFVLLARNQFWDRWTWPPGLIVVFGLNLSLMVGSAVMLQRAARKARAVSLERLKIKVEKASQTAAPTPEKHQEQMAQKLFDEVQNLRKGAFAPFWENPVVGAILVPSGGTAALELLRYLLG